MNKFDLTLTEPEDFVYEEIELFLSKVARREVEIESFNPAFSKKRMAPK